MVYESVPRTVRIILLGEPGVGKTSLILSLVTEEFTEQVPPKAEEITIPADVTPEQVPTNIIDVCLAEQSLEQVAEEIEKAHVICIVFSVDKQETLNKVASYWLPFVRDNCPDDYRKPVILVGNKIDLIDYSVIDNIWDIAEEYPEVDRCIECSAKTLTNVSEMFYNAQKAVLHPIGPIYSIEEQEVLDEVKSVIAQNIAGGIENECITMKGFIFLHCLFIQRGKNETTWTVLRKFGYDESLELTHNYLYANIKVPIGCTAELSYKGQQFLTQIFEKYDRDKDGMLNPTELKNVFSCCPRIPWHNLRYTVPTNDKGFLTLHGWMCRWTLMTLLDLQNTSAYFAYMGFNFLENESQKTAIHITREKKVDLAKKQSSRNVYQCHVIGPRSCGKTSICRSFLGIAHKKIKPHANERGDGYNTESCCINTVLVYGQEKYLVLKEIPITRVSDPLQPHEVNCDVACLVYDVSASRSFEYIARIYIKYFAESHIPVLIVGTKGEAMIARQEYILQPDVFCNKYQILPPQFFNIKENKQDIFVKLATMAAFPHLKHFASLAGDNSTWWKAGIGVAAATIMGLVLIRMLNIHRR
ncbi:mitochondrial Rho GTPase isoform X3 [Battus philenor]|uniref:mitochondrial Rho GTPase isoform X3 n=1 Tax=Battus philenor TaxID=42288 RepID=UPI0035D0C9F3